MLLSKWPLANSFVQRELDEFLKNINGASVYIQQRIARIDSTSDQVEETTLE